MKIKNSLKVLSIIFAIGILSFQLSCAAKPSSQAGTMAVPVRRGNLTLDITGAGNLALSQTEDMAFEIAGYVLEVPVKEGEAVKEGQLLAQIDTSEWEKQVKTLEKTLVTAQRTLTARERDLTKAERLVETRELALQSVNLDLQTAEYNLSQIADVKIAQNGVDSAQNDLDLAQSNLRLALAAGNETQVIMRQITDCQAALVQANQKLQSVLQGKSINITTTVAMQIAQYQLRVEQSKRALEDAQIAIEDAKIAVDNAGIAKEDADQDVKDAQADLDEARSLSPLIKAPFAGFITKINVKGGDEVFKGTVAMQLADPAKFTADITVGENDIIKVKEGGAATIQVDAISGLTVPATVTHIAPTATVQSGVVSYKVTVEMQSLESSQTSVQSQPILPSGPDSTPATSRPNQFSFQPGSGRATPPSATLPRIPALTSQTSQIKAGMSVTVSIVVAESKDILLVPNQAITYSGRTSQVEVMKDGVSETRTIKTGINNWQYTEVTEGLSEGEQVVITNASASTGTSRPGSTAVPRVTQQAQPVIIPGQGGIRTR